MKCAKTFTLQPSEKLAGIRKEKWTKPRDGKDVAYVVVDRLGQCEFIGQKIPLLVDAINEQASEPCARVSINGLWVSVDKTDGYAGPWCKGRWRVRSVELDAACEEYERARPHHQKAIIVADQPSCYVVCA